MMCNCTSENPLAHKRDPKVAEHRGRVVKNTGDGMSAEFSSVVDAVRCALAVQRRWGLNTQCRASGTVLISTLANAIRTRSDATVTRRVPTLVLM
jgi:hypothetical protein